MPQNIEDALGVQGAAEVIEDDFFGVLAVIGSYRLLQLRSGLLHEGKKQGRVKRPVPVEGSWLAFCVTALIH